MSKKLTREQEKAMFAKQNEGKSYKKDHHASTHINNNSNIPIRNGDFVEISDPEEPGEKLIGEVCAIENVDGKLTYNINTELGDYDISSKDIHRRVPESEMWEPQERTFTVDKDGVIANYKATKGSEWTSGWDERVSDNLDNLKPGKYTVAFDGATTGGSDAIKDVRIFEQRTRKTDHYWYRIYK